ncbi:helix-turn-helix domain-containing protein [bacterium]|nr:helix-turn-helix domain-containing protein [bacterium]NUN44401.1 AraC family transcriptional regulator [bacterium]
MILIAGVSIAAFIAALLISKKQKAQGDVILTAWMMIIAVQMLFYHAYITDIIFRYPAFLAWERPLPLLHGVLLYWYVATMTDQMPSSKFLLYLHFIPTLIFYLVLIPFFLRPVEEKIWVYRNEGAGYETLDTLRMGMIILSGTIYIIWSAILLSRHKRRILNRFSYEEKINLQWLRILTWGLGAVWLLIFVSDEVLSVGVTIFVFMIGFFGIRQSRIFKTTEINLEEPEKEKYAKSGLTKETAETLYAGLMRLMNEDAVYQKNDLSIYDLATRLDVHPNYLSQVINELEKKNFYDFVNQYRLNHFIKLISDTRNRHLTFLALAYESGFNSKSSFNRYFKKATGKTPSEYFSSEGLVN